MANGQQLQNIQVGAQQQPLINLQQLLGSQLFQPQTVAAPQLQAQEAFRTAGNFPLLTQSREDILSSLPEGIGSPLPSQLTSIGPIEQVGVHQAPIANVPVVPDQFFPNFEQTIGAGVLPEKLGLSDEQLALLNVVIDNIAGGFSSQIPDGTGAPTPPTVIPAPPLPTSKAVLESQPIPISTKTGLPETIGITENDPAQLPPGTLEEQLLPPGFRHLAGQEVDPNLPLPPEVRDILGLPTVLPAELPTGAPQPTVAPQSVAPAQIVSGKPPTPKEPDNVGLPSPIGLPPSLAPSLPPGTIQSTAPLQPVETTPIQNASLPPSLSAESLPPGFTAPGVPPTAQNIEPVNQEKSVEIAKPVQIIENPNDPIQNINIVKEKAASNLPKTLIVKQPTITKKKKPVKKTASVIKTKPVVLTKEQQVSKAKPKPKIPEGEKVTLKQLIGPVKSKKSLFK